MPKCDKCRQMKPDDEVRVYHLTLRTTNLQNPIDKIILCTECDANRHTNPLRYINL